MGKRKRDENPAAIGVKRLKVSQKLHYTTKKVTHAFKLAKGFERQKLGRRQKKAVADNNEKDQQRIQEEIVELKALNLQQIAQLFYHKYLQKNRDIRESKIFEGLVDIPELEIKGAKQNVVARLCNTQAVKKAFQDSHDDVLQASGIPLPKLARKDRGRMERVRAREQEEDVEFSEDEESNSEQVRPLELANTQVQGGENGTLQWAIDDLDGNASQPLSTASKLATSESLEDDGDDSGVVSEDDLESSSSDSEAERMSKRSRPSTSTILPSLTAGYISGSDGSDIGDIDEPVRKNRRGQRARQAIWEKKYGSGANHVKNAATSRDAGWDAKRGATGSDRWQVASKPKANGSSRKPETMLTQSKPKPKRDDSGPIHPSWQAAKQAKAKGGSLPVFSGTKIAFD